MAHFAELGPDNITLRVIVVADTECLDASGVESEALGIGFCQRVFGPHTRWRQTSYNANLRKNYAGVGYRYDEARDAFIPPKPYPSWTLNDETCQWQAPVPVPGDGPYRWDEDEGRWVTP